MKLKTVILTVVLALVGLCSLAAMAETPVVVTPPACMSGTWYDPAFSGNGIDLQVQADQAFTYVSMFTYDNSTGEATWFVSDVNAAPVSGVANSYRLGMYQSTGASWHQGAFTTDKVGTFTLVVNSPNSIDFSWQLEGQAYSDNSCGFTQFNSFCASTWHLVPLVRPQSCAAPTP